MKPFGLREYSIAPRPPRLPLRGLGEHFIDHRHVGLALREITRLPLDHAERGLHVAALAAMGEVFLAAVQERPEHLAPRARPGRGGRGDGAPYGFGIQGWAKPFGVLIHESYELGIEPAFWDRSA